MTETDIFTKFYEKHLDTLMAPLIENGIDPIEAFCQSVDMARILATLSYHDHTRIKVELDVDYE